jgi:outer membrane usher protein FimD/PapC
MASLNPRAASPLLALIAAATAVSGGSARAQESDPFALPRDLTVKAVEQVAGPGLSEIEVDGSLRRRMVTLTGRGDALTIDADEARAAGLPVPEGAAGPMRLSALALYKWEFDSLRQRLVVKLLRNSDGANFRDLSKPDWELTRTTPLLALRVDYDLTASLTPTGRSAGGLFDAALVRGDLALATSARIDSDPGRDAGHFVRLDSAVHWNLPRASTSVTVGDFVSAGTLTQRAVRLGGIQLASNFELRPDLLTTPLPSFSGQVAVPTSIDILTADQRYRVGEVEPGSFTLRNVPLGTGRGEFSVITRDALGREVVQAMRFYTSRNLLAPGLTGYAVNAGFVRRRYGEASNDYGEFVASAFARRGLSPFLTVEGSGEATAGLANFGARADFTLGNIALASAEGRYSRDTDAGTGYLTRFSLESTSEGFGVRAGIVRPTASYRDVASRLGDGAPSSQVFADISYVLGPNTRAQLAYVRQDNRGDPRIGTPARRLETLSGQFRMPISSRIDLFASGGMRRAEVRRTLFASIGVAVNLGAPHHLGAYAGVEGDRPTAGISYSKSDQREGDIGYRVAANVAPDYQRVSGSALWRAGAFALEGQVEEVNGAFAGRANARGSLIVADGTVYARSQTGNSFALVRSGKVADVAIKLENRVIGKTNHRGRLLVQNLLPLVPMRIDVDTEQLPAEAMVRQARHVIAVPRRAVALVEMDVIAFRPVLRQIVDTAGKPIEAGLAVTAAPSGATSLVGFDGMAEINAAGGDRRLLVGAPGRGCVVDLPGAEALETGEGPLMCRTEVIAQGQPPAGESAKRPRRAVKVARRD